LNPAARELQRLGYTEVRCWGSQPGLHNCFKARRHGRDVRGYLVSERPPANSTLWRELGADVAIVVTWPERFKQDILRSIDTQ
jgi:hypothetical protein